MTHSPPSIPGIVLFCLLLFLPGFSFPAGGADLYTIGVVPQKPPVVMHTNWTPFVERLAGGTGLRFRLKAYETMDAFEQDFLAGVPDFLFSSPTQLVSARQAQGYIPLVRDSRKIKGVLYVRKDSPITEPGQLDGKNIAFVGSKSLCCVIVKDRLAEQPETITFHSAYAGSSENVYKSVILGKADAGATLEAEVGTTSPEVDELLRPLFCTEEINPHPLSAHPRVAEVVRRGVADAVLRMGSDAKNKALLAAVRMPDPVAADYARDYQDIEEILRNKPAQDF